MGEGQARRVLLRFSAVGDEKGPRFCWEDSGGRTLAVAGKPSRGPKSLQTLIWPICAADSARFTVASIVLAQQLVALGTSGDVSKLHSSHLSGLSWARASGLLLVGRAVWQGGHNPSHPVRSPWLLRLAQTEAQEAEDWVTRPRPEQPGSEALGPHGHIGAPWSKVTGPLNTAGHSWALVCALTFPREPAASPGGNVRPSSAGPAPGLHEGSCRPLLWSHSTPASSPSPNELPRAAVATGCPAPSPHHLCGKRAH